MALDYTVGGESANSYGSETDADAYWADRPQSADWDALGSAQAGWLIAATERLEQLQYQGERTDEDQALSWPRLGAWVDGVEIEDDVIPEGMKRAQYKLALLLSEESTAVSALADTGLEDFERLKVDVIELVPRGGSKAGELPADIMREVRPYLLGGSVHQFRVARG